MLSLEKFQPARLRIARWISMVTEIFGLEIFDWPGALADIKYRDTR
jgi:hypothetical protein